MTQDLVEKVKSAKWNPDQNLEDREQRNALAARGYFKKHFSEVQNSVTRIFKGESPGEVVEQGIPTWYQKLFAPSARLGLIPLEDLFGYRRSQVYIRNSRHSPPAKEYLGEIMEAFFQCLKDEEHPAVRALLGHFIFVYIHPYMDGNGRIGRFHQCHVSFGKAIHGRSSKSIIAIFTFSALEAASVGKDILPFTRFILSEMPGL